MSAGPVTIDPPQDRAPRDPQGARLLGLVRTLLVLGRALLGTLESLGAARPPIDIARRFRCLDLTLIIARIRRGLMIAEALEARLLRRRPRLAPHASRPLTVRTQAPSRPTRRTDADDDAELRGTLPTADQIAARIRRRAVGAVFVDICRDLGLNTSHPDWREIQTAIVLNGGSMVTMLRHWTRHLPALVAIEQQAEAVSATFPSSSVVAPSPERRSAASHVPAEGRSGAEADPIAPRWPAAMATVRMPDLLASTSLTSAIVPACGVDPLFRDPLGRSRRSNLRPGPTLSATPPARPPRPPTFGPPLPAIALPR